MTEFKAKCKDYYSDPALAYVFMINNLSHIGYIGQKTHYMKFNDDWFTQKVEQNKMKFERIYYTPNIFCNSSFIPVKGH